MGRKKEETQQVHGKQKELVNRAGQNGAEAGDKVQDHVGTDSLQEAEIKKMGMREKMKQMGVSCIFVLHALPWPL